MWQQPETFRFLEVTPAEADALKRIARREIERRESQDKKQQLEKLAEELGYELTPIANSEE